MKRFILIASLLALAATTSPVKKQADGTVTINTTTLKADEGCFGPTPVIIYLDAQERVSKIEALPNTETPSYWNLVMEKLSTVWNGIPASEAASLEVDAVTGATYSSEGLISNVRSGLTYYQQSK